MAYAGYVTLLNVQDGAQGQDAQKYQIETNQEEILRFFVQERAWSLSPDDLIISLYENDPLNEEGKVKLNFSSIEEIQLSILNTSGKDWINIDFTQAGGEQFYRVQSGDLVVVLSEIARFYDENIIGDFYTICEILTTRDTILKISYRKEVSGEIYLIEKNISVRNAVTSDLAKLSVQASGIYASIASTALSFQSDGLTIRNGGLTLKKAAYEVIDLNEENFITNQYYVYEPSGYVLAESYSESQTYFKKLETNVLYGDKDGNLTISGTIYADNGKFTGEINATSGKFTGEINATSGKFTGEINANIGTIGGFEIAENCISAGNNLKLYSNYEGKGSLLQATNIELGEGAKIMKSLGLGERVQILNPDENSNSYIKVTNDGKTVVNHKDDGSIILGDEAGSYIKLDGMNQEIIAKNGASILSTWSLTPNEAIFNNVVVRGSIKTAVFEQGSIQAIGGTLLMRPSSKIVSIEEPELIDEKYYTSICTETELDGTKVGDKCLIQIEGMKNYYTINKIEGKLIILEGQIDSISVIGTPIINLGQSDSIAIGFNATNSESYMMPANAISILNFDAEKEELEPKIILGKLPQGSTLAGTYGLYAENVILNGSLTTKSGFQDQVTNYSGIGTTLVDEGAPSTNGMSTRFPNSELGQILLWAGARGDSKEAIEDSKFFVDQYGNMYAGSGYFDGTIITNSTIRASRIETLEIVGYDTEKNNQAALTIRDADVGILFKGPNDDDIRFSLGKAGMEVKLPVKINEKFEVNGEGQLIVPKITLIDGMNLEGGKISRKSSSIELLENSEIKLAPNTEAEIIVSNDGMSINKNIYYKQKSPSGAKTIMEYKQALENGVVIGYDLYVL